MNDREAALVVAGHGSTLNADSSAPTFQHAQAIRERALFAEVHECFWKEEPNFRQTLRAVEARRIYIVPNFISSGYFTERVLPREFGLTGPITRGADGREIYYCEPVGLHPVMTDTLLHRAEEVVRLSGVTIAHPRATACLLICGHGTSLNDNSTKIIQQRVEEIRARGLYAECAMVLMEQKPYVKDWRTLTACPDVIVVPYFISDGLHSFEDIPVLMGLTENVRVQGVQNPHLENGRRLWYATAIGTEPMIADVILAQVEKFNADHHDAMSSDSGVSVAGCSAQPCFKQWLETTPVPWMIGQLVLTPGYELRHVDDCATAAETLSPLKPGDWAAWREWIRDDAQGNFRPLKAAPDLRRGWRLGPLSFEDILLALQYLYPAELANWALWRDGKLPVTPWVETAQRQSGRYHIVHTVDASILLERVAQVCEPGCLKQRLWSPAAETVRAGASEIPLLCPEACNYFVEKVRGKLKGVEEEPA